MEGKQKQPSGSTNDRQGNNPRANRGRSLSTRKPSTRSRTTSKQRNHRERADTRARSHSICRQKIQAPALSASAEDRHTPISRSKSCSRDRSKSRTSSKRWSSSAINRSSARVDVSSQSCGRSKSNLKRTTKSAADVTDFVRGGTMRRSRSMPRNKSEPSIRGSAATLSPAVPSQRGKLSDSNAKVTAPSSRRFVVEVDEDMNIIKLNEVNTYIETNGISNEKYQMSRRRSSSVDGRKLTTTQAGYRQNRRRSSSCEPPVTQSLAFCSSIPRSSITSRSRTGLNQSRGQSEAVSIMTEDNNIKRVSSYSRQVLDFDPSNDLKQSLSTQATPTIDDDDSFAFEEPTIPSEAEDVGSNLAVVAIAGAAEQLDPSNKFTSKTSPKRMFFRKKTIRHSVPDTSEEGEKTMSVLMTSAANSLEAQHQKTKQKSGKGSRLYKMINRYQ